MAQKFMSLLCRHEKVIRGSVCEGHSAYLPCDSTHRCVSLLCVHEEVVIHGGAVLVAGGHLEVGRCERE